jgi:hypothetical protein
MEGEAYFALEVFAHNLHFTNQSTDSLLAGAGSWPTSNAGFPRMPFALAFAFLDYPLLICYANEAPHDLARSGSATSYGSLAFGSGKSCILSADPGELQFLLEQVGRA